MKKELYFVKTNGYNMLVSVDGHKNCRYLTETIDFPNVTNLNKEEKENVISGFLQLVEDDSSWEDDCSYYQIFEEFPVEIILSIEKDL